MQANSYPDVTRLILAVEVLSPGNRKRKGHKPVLLTRKFAKASGLGVPVLRGSLRKKEVQSKVALYRRFGIEAWVVNPKCQEIQIYRDKEVVSLKHPQDPDVTFAVDRQTIPAIPNFRPLLLIRLQLMIRHPLRSQLWYGLWYGDC